MEYQYMQPKEWMGLLNTFDIKYDKKRSDLLIPEINKCSDIKSNEWEEESMIKFILGWFSFNKNKAGAGGRNPSSSYSKEDQIYGEISANVFLEMRFY